MTSYEGVDNIDYTLCESCLGCLYGCPWFGPMTIKGIKPIDYYECYAPNGIKMKCPENKYREILD